MIELLMLAVLISLVFLIVVIFGFIVRLWKGNLKFKDISSDSWFDFAVSILKWLLMISILGLLMYLITVPIPNSLDALYKRVLEKGKGFIYLIGLLLVSALLSLFEFAACLGIIESIVGSPDKKAVEDCKTPKNDIMPRQPINPAVTNRRTVQTSVNSMPIACPVIIREEVQHEDITTVNSEDGKSHVIESSVTQNTVSNGEIQKERRHQRKAINKKAFGGSKTTPIETHSGETFKKKVNDILYSDVAIPSRSKKDAEPLGFSEIDRMNGVQFEKFCVELLKRNGFHDVKMTRKTGDQGVDITAKKGNDRYAIQCKHWKQNVGNGAVQEIHAGKLYYDCNVSVVMTNSHFTHSAIELAKKTHTLLWDRENLHYFMDYATRNPTKP